MWLALCDVAAACCLCAGYDAPDSLYRGRVLGATHRAYEAGVRTSSSIMGGGIG